MINDELHKFSANRKYFLHSIDRLRKGGLYIIEDIDRKEFESATGFIHQVQDIILVGISHEEDNADNDLLIIIK